MGFVARFLAGYGENFLVAVAAWPVVSATFTLPILAYLYHRDGRLRAGSAATTYLAVLYLLGLVCFTLYPLPTGSAGPGITYGIPWQLNPLAPLGDFAREGVRILPQIAFNVVLFLPWGFIAQRLLGRGLAASVITGFAASCAIELAQGTGLFGIYPYAFRTADVNDLMYNTCGAALGWWIAAALERVLPASEPVGAQAITHEPGLVRRCVAFWLDMMLAGALALVAIAVVSLTLPASPHEAATLGDMWPLAVAAGAFTLVEGIVPWMRGGSTPGGGFVRMSCETRPRSPVRRAVFYVARLAVLGGSCLAFPFAWPVLALFYLVARRMPYDFV